jgi:uncharacterized protein YegP (UPF0339 family)
MKKKYHFLIKDARGGFRVYQVAPNGEIINSTQVLDTVDNVYKNIIAAMKMTYLIAPSTSFRSMIKRRKEIAETIQSGRIRVVYEGKKDIGILNTNK